MRKILNLFILILCFSLVLTACSKPNIDIDSKAKDQLVDDNTEFSPDGLNVGINKNINSLALARLKSTENKAKDLKCNYIEYDTYGLLAVDLAKGNLDIAAIPADLAATIYNSKKDEIKIVAITTLGNYYIMENGKSIETTEDLENNTIYITGEKNVPNAILNKFLIESNLKNIKIVHKENSLDIKEILNSEENSIAMIDEPFATELSEANPNIRKVFDMNEKWSSFTKGDPLVNGVLVVRNKSLEDKSKDLKEYLSLYQDSVFEIREDITLSAKILEQSGLVAEGLGEKILEDSHFVYINSEEMAYLLNNYYGHLVDFDPSLLGGKLPDENIYFIK